MVKCEQKIDIRKPLRKWRQGSMNRRVHWRKAAYMNWEDNRMGLFDRGKKKAAQQSEKEKVQERPANQQAQKEQKEKGKQEEQEKPKQYIAGAGACIVTKSILSGASKLKWLFRQDGGIGNGWVAFGDRDTQEYVDKAENMAVVDFNTLANIEPAVVNVFYMPMGTDLEFRADQSGKYFIDTRTGKEIREPVKHPAQIAFEKNLKFLNRESYPLEFFRGLFPAADQEDGREADQSIGQETERTVGRKAGQEAGRTDGKLQQVMAGKVDFPTGAVVLADPMVYLGSEKYQTCLERRIPAGCYSVWLSICRSRIAGLRIAAAKLQIAEKEPVRYELAMPKGHTIEDFNKPGVFSFFGVDAGLACFADEAAAAEYGRFIRQWHEEHPGKNHYDDYFAALFQQSYEANPALQNRGGDYLSWQIPESGNGLVLFSSGMGDGIYSGYWGLDEDGEAVELVIPFMNPEYF